MTAGSPGRATRGVFSVARAGAVTCDEGGRRCCPDPGGAGFDPEAVRADFPAPARELRPGVSLTYLDTASTALKPRSVIRAVRDEEILERYHDAPLRGRLEAPDLPAEPDNPLCGDQIRLEMSLGPEGRLGEVRWRSTGTGARHHGRR